jgi:hypothetical protein
MTHSSPGTAVRWLFAGTLGLLAILAGLLAVLGVSGDELIVSPSSASVREGIDPEARIVARWTVRDGDLYQLLEGGGGTEVWDEVTVLVPVDELRRLGEFVVVDSETFDGWAAPLRDGSWRIAVDPDARKLDHTILHEIAHVVTGTDEDTSRECGWMPYGYCPRPASPLDVWVREHWEPLGVLDDIAAAGIGTEEARLVTEELLAMVGNQFVTGYAATLPTEDFAETFASWASGEQARTPAVQRKYRTLERLWEFVDIRNHALDR